MLGTHEETQTRSTSRLYKTLQMFSNCWFVFFKPGFVGDGGRHAERQIHQERQQQGPDHHQNSGRRRTRTGQWLQTHSIDKMQYANFSCSNRTSPWRNIYCVHRVTATREWMLRGFSRKSKPECEVHILFLYIWQGVDMWLAIFSEQEDKAKSSVFSWDFTLYTWKMLGFLMWKKHKSESVNLCSVSDPPPRIT